MACYERIAKQEVSAMRNVVLFPGQRVVLTSGETAIVAFVRYGQVWVFGRNGLPVAAEVCHDAFGGEVDQSIGVPDAA